MGDTERWTFGAVAKGALSVEYDGDAAFLASVLADWPVLTNGVELCPFGIALYAALGGRLSCQLLRG